MADEVLKRDANHVPIAGVLNSDGDIVSLKGNKTGTLNVKTDFAHSTAFGDMRMAELTPVIQHSFEYTVSNTELTTNTTANDGTITQASGMAVLQTSTTAGGTATMISKRHARYRAGLGGLTRFTALFTSPVASTVQLAGLADEAGSTTYFKNGYMVGYDGTTFGLHRFQNDAITTVAQADWDDPLDGTGISEMTLDQTKINVFAINFQYLGAGKIQLLIEDDDTGDFTLVHTIDYANANITPSTHNPNYHITFFVDNIATASNLTLKTSSCAYFIEGKTKYYEIHQPTFSSGTRTKTSVTTEVAIFTIRNKASYASKTNFIDLIPISISASIEASSANNLASVRLVRNATLGGSPSYADINANNSIVDIDVAGTTVTGGTEIFNIQLAGKNDKAILDISGYELLLQPGETLTLAASSVNSADSIKGGLLWRELF